MKILFLDQYSEMGGGQCALVDLLDAAAERGWQAWVALPGAGPLVEKVRARGFTVIEIPCGPYQAATKRVGDMARFASDLRQQVRILADWMNCVEFDLTYVNGARVLPAAALAVRQRMPVVFHAHNYLPRRSVSRLAGWSIRRANAEVIAVSEFVAEPLRRHAAPNKLHVIANGVREVQFRERGFGREASWNIGLIGRISPEKGQAEFVRAAALVHAAFQKAKFIVCGAPLFAQPGYSELVQELARELPVEFLGWSDNMGPVWSELDLLVVPSKQEPMGRVVVEAFSAGVPVVAFPTGGIPEMVADGETGFLVRKMSADGLAERICAIIDTEPAALRSVAANARRRWEGSYTLPAAQQRITELMERLVSDRPAVRETAMPQARK